MLPTTGCAPCVLLCELLLHDCVEKYKSIKKKRFNIIIYKILSLNLYLLFFGLLRYFTVLTKLLSNVTHRGTHMLTIN